MKAKVSLSAAFGFWTPDCFGETLRFFFLLRMLFVVRSVPGSPGWLFDFFSRRDGVFGL
jgi:hypothetical protein